MEKLTSMLFHLFHRRDISSGFCVMTEVSNNIVSYMNKVSEHTWISQVDDYKAVLEKELEN